MAVTLSLLLIAMDGWSISVNAQAAVPSVVTSVQQKPVVLVEGNTYRWFLTYYNQNDNPQYQTTVITVVGGSNLLLNEGLWIKSDTEFTCHLEVYDTADWNLLRVIDDGVLYNQYKNIYQCLIQGGQFTYYTEVPGGITYNSATERNDCGEDFVRWATVAPQWEILKSYMSEPVCDRYNRYMVLGTTEHTYLYWLSLTQYQIEYVDSTETLDLTTTGSPYNIVIRYDQTGVKLAWEYKTLDYASQPLCQLVYQMRMYKFDLENGTYIGAWSFEGTATSETQGIDVSAAFGETYTSVDVKGLCFVTTEVVNKATIKWAYEPMWEEWKTQQERYLQRIIALLEQTGEAETINADESQKNEMQSARDALAVTDENGSKVGAGEAAGQALSEAAEEFDKVGDGVEAVNGIMNNILFKQPIVLLPLIVALGLGIVVTVLGKNKSD